MHNRKGNKQDHNPQTEKHTPVTVDETRTDDGVGPVLLKVHDPVHQIDKIPVQGAHRRKQEHVFSGKKPAERKHSKGGNDSDMETANACQHPQNVSFCCNNRFTGNRDCVQHHTDCVPSCAVIHCCFKYVIPPVCLSRGRVQKKCNILDL